MQSLAEFIFENEEFKSELHFLTVDSVATQFPSLIRDGIFQSGFLIDWSYLLLAASGLAQSGVEDHLSAALRIAQACVVSDSSTPRQKDTAAFVLDALVNRVSIELAISRRHLSDNIYERLPLPARIEWTRRNIEYSICLNNGSTLMLSKFQHQLWQLLAQNDWTSFSAPTSAGKSFVLSQWIANKVRSDAGSTIIYVVPTRALITQVERDLRVLAQGIRRETGVRVGVSSMPLMPTGVNFTSQILVFTQERLHAYLNRAQSNSRISTLIVDEAHKVGDRQRGILLQQVIEQIAKNNPEAKIIYSSPLIGNPDTLLADASNDLKSSSFTSLEPTVNQNLLWVTQRSGKPKEWIVSLQFPDQSATLGTVTLPSAASNVMKRLPYVACALGSTISGNIIYVNGAADAEKTAQHVFSQLPAQNSEDISQDVLDLVDLVKRSIHPDYLLATCLTRGVAFHYGNMPLLIRSEIERLFSLGHLNFLVCTSTLIEGVNMSCRNIFVRGPRKGRSQRMTEQDFWNLGGRAGRWGKEFQGNIVCVDTDRLDVWEGQPPRKRELSRVERTSDTLLRQSEDLIDFIQQGTPRSVAHSRPELEFVFSYLVGIRAREGSIYNSPWAKRYTTEQLDPVASLIDGVHDRLQVTPEIIQRNPGISPLAMDNLLKYFEERGLDPNEYLPLEPGHTDAARSYARILSRIGRNLDSSIAPSPKRAFMLALLVTRWMRGMPLAALIKDRISHEGAPEAKIPVIIRSVMEDVEQIARYAAPKYISCYVDVLHFYLQKIGRPDLGGQSGNLDVLLEFGVSSQEQLTLMGLGLSRTSAIYLYEILNEENLIQEGTTITEAELIAWLSTEAWKASNLPALVAKEIQSLMDLLLT